MKAKAGTYYISPSRTTVFHINAGNLGEGERLLCGRRMWQGYGYTSIREMVHRPICKTCESRKP